MGLWDKGSKYFHWLLFRAELEASTATGESWHMAEGLHGGCAAPSGRPKGADPLEATADWTYCASGWVTSSPSPNLAARLKLCRKLQYLIKPVFLSFFLSFRFFFFLYFHFSNGIFESKEETREVVIPTCLCARCLSSMKAWSRPKFNPLFCLGSLEFALPTTKKNHPAAEIWRDVFGCMETFLWFCHACFLWSQFLFVGRTQILMEQKRRTVRGTTWYNIFSQKYGGNLLHFLLFALQ